MKQISRFPILLAFFATALSSCETVSSTAQFYRPFTTDTYPQKTKDYQVPILGAKPKRKFIAIGRLSFSATQGHAFMIRAIEYNARRVGADAAILIDSNSAIQHYTYNVPGYTTYQPVTTYGTAQANASYFGSGGYGYGSAYGTSTSTTYVPQYNPGYTGIGSVTRHYIDALLIRFK
jgi:hypothetical protein